MSGFERYMRALGRGYAALTSRHRREIQQEVAITRPAVNTRRIEQVTWTAAGSIAGGCIAAAMFGALLFPLMGPLSLLSAMPAFWVGFQLGGTIGKMIGKLVTW